MYVGKYGALSLIRDNADNLESLRQAVLELNDAEAAWYLILLYNTKICYRYSLLSNKNNNSKRNSQEGFYVENKCIYLQQNYNQQVQPKKLGINEKLYQTVQDAFASGKKYVDLLVFDVDSSDIIKPSVFAEYGNYIKSIFFDDTKCFHKISWAAAQYISTHPMEYIKNINNPNVSAFLHDFPGVVDAVYMEAAQIPAQKEMLMPNNIDATMPIWGEVRILQNIVNNTLSNISIKTALIKAINTNAAMRSVIAKNINNINVMLFCLSNSQNRVIEGILIEKIDIVTDVILRSGSLEIYLIILNQFSSSFYKKLLSNQEILSNILSSSDSMLQQKLKAMISDIGFYSAVLDKFDNEHVLQFILKNHELFHDFVIKINLHDLLIKNCSAGLEKTIVGMFLHDKFIQDIVERDEILHHLIVAAKQNEMASMMLDNINKPLILNLIVKNLNKHYMVEWIIKHIVNNNSHLEILARNHFDTIIKTISRDESLKYTLFSMVDHVKSNFINECFHALFEQLTLSLMSNKNMQRVLLQHLDNIFISKMLKNDMVYSAILKEVCSNVQKQKELLELIIHPLKVKHAAQNIKELFHSNVLMILNHPKVVQAIESNIKEHYKTLANASTIDYISKILHSEAVFEYVSNNLSLNEELLFTILKKHENTFLSGILANRTSLSAIVETVSQNVDVQFAIVQNLNQFGCDVILRASKEAFSKTAYKNYKMQIALLDHINNTTVSSILSTDNNNLLKHIIKTAYKADTTELYEAILRAVTKSCMYSNVSEALRDAILERNGENKGGKWCYTLISLYNNTELGSAINNILNNDEVINYLIHNALSDIQIRESERFEMKQIILKRYFENRADPLKWNTSKPTWIHKMFSELYATRTIASMAHGLEKDIAFKELLIENINYEYMPRLLVLALDDEYEQKEYYKRYEDGRKVFNWDICEILIRNIHKMQEGQEQYKSLTELVRSGRIPNDNSVKERKKTLEVMIEKLNIIKYTFEFEAKNHISILNFCIQYLCQNSDEGKRIDSKRIINIETINNTQTIKNAASRELTRDELNGQVVYKLYPEFIISVFEEPMYSAPKFNSLCKHILDYAITMASKSNEAMYSHTELFQYFLKNFHREGVLEYVLQSIDKAIPLQINTSNQNGFYAFARKLFDGIFKEYTLKKQIYVNYDYYNYNEAKKMIQIFEKKIIDYLYFNEYNKANNSVYKYFSDDANKNSLEVQRFFAAFAYEAVIFDNFIKSFDDNALRAVAEIYIAHISEGGIYATPSKVVFLSAASKPDPSLRLCDGAKMIIEENVYDDVITLGHYYDSTNL